MGEASLNEQNQIYDVLNGAAVFVVISMGVLYVFFSARECADVREAGSEPVRRADGRH